MEVVIGLPQIKHPMSIGVCPITFNFVIEVFEFVLHLQRWRIYIYAAEKF